MSYVTGIPLAVLADEDPEVLATYAEVHTEQQRRLGDGR